MFAMPHDLGIGLQVVRVKFRILHVDLKVTFDVVHFGVAAGNPTLNSVIVTPTLLTFFLGFFRCYSFLLFFFIFCNFFWAQAQAPPLRMSRNQNLHSCSDGQL